MITLYIILNKNRMTVRNLNDGCEYSGVGTFSNARLLVAHFFTAEKVLSDLLKQVRPAGWATRLLRKKHLRILVDALELNEGGLSPVEERAIMEMVAVASAHRYRQLEIRSCNHVRSDTEVHALLADHGA